MIRLIYSPSKFYLYICSTFLSLAVVFPLLEAMASPDAFEHQITLKSRWSSPSSHHFLASTYTKAACDFVRSRSFSR